MLFDLVLFVSIAVLGLNSLWRYFYRKGDKFNLYLGIACFFYSAKIFFISETIASFYLGDLSWALREKIIMGTLFMSFSFLVAFTQNLFKENINKDLVLISFIKSVSFSILAFVPSKSYLFLTLSYVMIAQIELLYLFYYLKKVVNFNKKYAKLVFFALIILNVLALNEFVLKTFFMKSTILLDMFLLCLVFVVSDLRTRESADLLNRVQEASEKLKKIDKLKDDFLVYSSRELINPLNGIVGLSSSMLRLGSSSFTAEDKRNLALIVSAGKRLSNVVNDILDFSKIKENSIKMNKTSVSLHNLAEVVLSTFKPIIAGRKVNLLNEIPSDFPLALGDEARLQQVLFNIIANSLKLSAGGDVSITAENLDDYAKVNISCPACSLSSEMFEKILTTYEKGDLSYLENYEGNGIGLVVSKHLIELNDGELHVADAGKSCTVFNFTIPLDKNNPVAGRSDQEDLKIYLNALENIEPVLTLEEKEEHYKVLVVDDDVVDLQVLKSILALDGYHVIPVLTGEEALEKLNETTVDIILLDIMLPGIDGYETLRQIRLKHNTVNLPVIMISAQEQIEDMTMGLKLGANDFLTKPLKQEELLSRVKTHLHLTKTNAIYNRFVPNEFLNLLGHDNIVGVKLGDQTQREMTVFFADIRGFTNLSEQMTPEENFKFINSYLSRLSPVIRENNGFVDKYIGDSIMALYPYRPEDSLNTAIEMMKNLHVYNGHRANCNYRPINIGVGIHTGSLILGVIGDNYRMQGTVISDAVNLASRIQDVTKLYGANIIISQDTFVQLENPTEYNFRFLGKVRVKGKENSVALFEIFDSDPKDVLELKSETKGDFEKGILLFAKRDFVEAEKLFSAISATNPADKAAALFLERTRKFLIEKGIMHL